MITKALFHYVTFFVDMAEPMRFRFGRPHLLHKAESHNLIGLAMFDNKKVI
jgi:hypothetical protein